MRPCKNVDERRPRWKPRHFESTGKATPASDVTRPRKCRIKVPKMVRCLRQHSRQDWIWTELKQRPVRSGER